MSKAEVKSYASFVLPGSVVSRADVSRLVSEAERVDGELTTLAVRKKVGKAAAIVPTMSQSLTEFLAQNKIDLTESKVRSELVKQLRLLKENVPVIHMTFAVEADTESLQRITSWLRESVHPQAVVATGLQPALVAGVYLRTPNHVHDLSLRGKLKEQRGVLVKELEALRVGK